MPDNDKNAKRQKQQRKMTKILVKAWGMDESEAFQQDVASSTTDISSAQPIDLQSIGSRLDKDHYPFGRSGWEEFANDLGGVYRRHITGGSKKLAALAKSHLNEIVDLFQKIDEKLGELALDAKIPEVPKMLPTKSPLLDSPAKAKRVSSNGKVSRSSSNGTNSSKRSLSVTPATKGRPRSQRESDAEKKRLKKELDKLLKSHKKSTKALDDFRNEKTDTRYPIDDELLEGEDNKSIEPEKQSSSLVQLTPDISLYPGFPPHCIPDILMSWDFLCTFHKSLSLDPIGLDDYVAALRYYPTNSKSPDSHSNGESNGDNKGTLLDDANNIPVYLGEAHMALLNLLLQDKSSDSWWWCTLLTEAEVTNAEGTATTVNDKKRKRGAEEVNISEDNTAPVIKINMHALLSYPEQKEATIRWVQTLDSVRLVRANIATPFKNAVKNALAFTTNDYVKSYLKKAMKPWKVNSAAFTKRAVIWLVDRMREGRPDLLGKCLSQEEINAQINKVATETAKAMTEMPDDMLNMRLADEDGMDDASGDEDLSEDEDMDDDVFAQVDDLANDAEGLEHLAKRAKLNDGVDDESSMPVTSTVPPALSPTIVDILLPPTKPTPGSTIVSPFTWPCLVAATCRRVLHYFKKKRNEADEELRTKKLIKTMTRGERRRREANCSQRVFTECFAFNNEQIGPLESAIEFLSNGKPYLGLSPIQRLCLIRALIEGAYETYHVNKCVNDNFRDRINAAKALEAEERRAKKEIKDESTRADRAARERLASEARYSLLESKRIQIKKKNKKTNEFTNEFIEEMTEEDIINQDEEAQAEFEALPTPDSFSKVEVANMVVQMQEEEAFDATSLTVLTMADIMAKDQEALDTLKEELSSYGDIDNVYEGRMDRETSAKLDKIKREISNMECDFITLPEVRARASDELHEAIEDGTVKALRNAVKNAKLANLMGPSDSNGGVWALDILRDAAIELKAAEKRRKSTEAQRDLIAKKERCFVRSDPLGRDRNKNLYWHFVYDFPGRVWAEHDLFLIGKIVDSIGAKEEEGDILIPEQHDKTIVSFKDRLKFCRQEFHRSGSIPSLPLMKWGGFSSDKALRNIAKRLDERGIREGALKAEIKEALEARVSVVEKLDPPTESTQGDGHATEAVPNQNENVLTQGDENAILDAFAQYHSNDCTYEIPKTAIKARIRLREKKEVTVNGILPLASATYDMGTVTGWRKAVCVDEDPVWQVSMDKGGEKFLSGNAIVEGIVRHRKWLQENYVEEDASLHFYRNKLGKYYGKPSEASTAASALVLSRLMIKREQDLYAALKSRTYDNNWGGKTGARIAWVASLREFGHSVEAVRDSLVTLEEAFYELVNGETPPVLSADDMARARETLNDPSARFDVELESMGAGGGLWNSQECRNMYLEIIKDTTSISFVALGLDLLCRNVKAYLDAMGMSSRTATAVNSSVAPHEPYAYSSGIGTRSSRQSARNVNYEDFF